MAISSPRHRRAALTYIVAHHRRPDRLGVHGGRAVVARVDPGARPGAVHRGARWPVRRRTPEQHPVEPAPHRRTLRPARRSSRSARAWWAPSSHSRPWWAQGWSADVAVLGTAAMALNLSIWWIYFSIPVGRHAGRPPGAVVRLGLSPAPALGGRSAPAWTSRPTTSRTTQSVSRRHGPGRRDSGGRSTCDALRPVLVPDAYD